MGSEEQLEKYLSDIASKRYGREVRSSIISAIRESFSNDPSNFPLDIRDIVWHKTNTNIFDPTDIQPGYWNQDGYQADKVDEWVCTSRYYYVKHDYPATMTLYGAEHLYVTFWTDQKTFIQSIAKDNTSTMTGTTINIPNNAVYFTVSYSKNGVNKYTVYYGNTAGTDTSYTDWYRIRVDRVYPYHTYVVDSNRNYGEFTSIIEAVAKVPDYSVLLIGPGTYKGPLRLRGKHLKMIGVSPNPADQTIYVENGLYENPPAEITGGIYANLQFYAKSVNNWDWSNKKTAYGVHIDFDEMQDTYSRFVNCSFISDYNAAVGMGTRKNSSVAFIDCGFTSYGGSLAAIWAHDCPNQSLAGSSRMSFIGCRFSSTQDAAMYLASINYPGNYIDFLAHNCSFAADKATKMDDLVRLSAVADIYPSGFGGSHFLDSKTIYLNRLSYGNNVPKMNFSY